MNDYELDAPETLFGKKDKFAEFQKELSRLINKYSLENVLGMPDFILAELLVNILREMQLAYVKNNSWHVTKT